MLIDHHPHQLTQLEILIAPTFYILVTIQGLFLSPHPLMETTTTLGARQSRELYPLGKRLSSSTAVFLNLQWPTPCLILGKDAIALSFLGSPAPFLPQFCTAPSVSTMLETYGWICKIDSPNAITSACMIYLKKYIPCIKVTSLYLHFFTNMKILRDELEFLRPTPSYQSVRSQILIMNPLPTIIQVYSMVLQQERTPSAKLHHGFHCICHHFFKFQFTKQGFHTSRQGQRLL